MALNRRLRVGLLVGLAVTLGAILVGFFTVSESSPAQPPLPAPEAARAGRRVAQLASNVEIARTRRGLPTLRLEAAESITYSNGGLDLSRVTFRLFAPEGDETVVESPSATSNPSSTVAGGSPPAGRLGSWLLQGGVAVKTSEGLALRAPSLVYDETRESAQTPDTVLFTRGTATGSALGMAYDVAAELVGLQKNVTASMPLGSMGLVKVEAASASYDLKHRSLDLNAYRAATARGERLTGKRLAALFGPEGGIQRLEGFSGFVLETTHAAPASDSPSPLSKLLALEGTRRMSGRRLALVFDPNSEPTSIEVSGEAILTATSGVGDRAASSLAAQTLVFDLVGGALSKARAAGEVRLQGAAREGESSGFRLTSRHLNAVFDPNLGLMTNLEGEGEISLSDREMQSHGSRTHLDPDSDIVILSGEQDRPANATWFGRKIQAQRIEADRKRKTLSAVGGVRASFQPPPPDPGASARQSHAMPFFRTGETIYAMAGSVIFSELGKVVKYKDRVRLWQAENRLEASDVDLDETAGILEARGEVTSTFRQKPSPAAPTSDSIIAVTASAMRYERSANRVIYSGGVMATQGPLRVTSDSMHVLLAAEGSGAERVQAEGNVVLRDQGREGQGDKLLANLLDDTLRLMGTGREAIVQDQTGQQVVRGTVLTMNRSGDRILVESGLGGRSWITLRPRQKGAPGVATDPQD